jgi:GT2 family glycosyltransferase
MRPGRSKERNFEAMVMKMDKPRVSVIVLNWNGKRFLEKCLCSLLNQDYSNFEALLVDNGSSDGSVEYVRNAFGKDDRLRIVALKDNYGFCKGNNIGIQHAKGDYVVILNNDTEVKPNFISVLVKVAETDETVGSVSCKILHYNGGLWYGQYFIHKGFIVPFFTQSIFKPALAEFYEHFSVNLANSGCAVLYRKDLIGKIEGFDEDFWSDWEDYDLGYRINLAGFKSVYVPIFLVLHVGGGSFGFSPERLVRIYRNMLSTYAKNYELKNLVFRFPIFMFILLPLYHIGWLIHRLCFSLPDFNKRKGIWYFFSLIKAYVQFISKLKILCNKRYAIRNLRKTSDNEIFRNTLAKFFL